ncbi:uncharacterized protein PRCAT00004119001 [Priceomyces carsonii]|uniref:uncharacterized protein n=1 Tax=Priceomyces carsonii TaxID=28549 RepID=UPI002ED8179E|nr:unnamed protein product [Priceomyces carsonii]
MLPHPPQRINPLKLKTSLKMTISKLKFIQDKKTALAKQQRRLLADLLNQGKESSATIRVENIIREDIYIELLEHLELYCELILARISLITDPNRLTLDPSLKEAVQSIIYATPSSELPEITNLRDIFVIKYGPEFGENASKNTDGAVPDKIVRRCAIEPPPETLVKLYLCEIARAYKAPYSGLKDISLETDSATHEETKDDDSSDNDNPGSGTAIKNDPVPISEDSAHSSFEPAPQKKPQNDFDALKARFDALRGN